MKLQTADPDALCVKCGKRIGLWFCARWCDECIDKLDRRPK